MTSTESEIKSLIIELPGFDDDRLVHLWKICVSRKSVAEQKLLKPLQLAIEKQRKLLGKARELDTTPLDQQSAPAPSDDAE